MKLTEIFQAVREFPAVRFELRQTQQALDRSTRECERLGADKSDISARLRFSEQKTEAYQAVLEALCPKQESLEEMKRLYKIVSPSLDASGFTLYRTAKKLTGIDVHTFFPYEDTQGIFEAMDGRQLLNCLIAARFDAVEWEAVEGSGCEKAVFREVDNTTLEYRAFEHRLYWAVLARMGFENMLAREVESKVTELKLYSPLYGELENPETDTPEVLDGHELKWFQETILQGIEDAQLPDVTERGLMDCFDGSESVDEKVISFFPTVEEIDGRLYGVAVCQIRGELNPGELEELREYCHAQFADAWGEGFAQRPRHTEYGDLCVSFYTDSSVSVLTKEEMDRIPSRTQHQPKRGGDTR